MIVWRVVSCIVTKVNLCRICTCVHLTLAKNYHLLTLSFFFHVLFFYSVLNPLFTYWIHCSAERENQINMEQIRCSVYKWMKHFQLEIKRREKRKTTMKKRRKTNKWKYKDEKNVPTHTAERKNCVKLTVLFSICTILLYMNIEHAVLVFFVFLLFSKPTAPWFTIFVWHKAKIYCFHFFLNCKVFICNF